MDPLHQIPPRSPFATSLSGSARETELRLRSIFQWKKKRPPVLFLLLAALCVLLCSSLVSCQTAEGASASSSPVLAPSGSNVPSYSQLSLLETLFGAVKGQMEADALSEASPSLLHASSREGVTLAAASFQDGSGVYLVVAAVAQDTGALTGSPYILSGQGALPQVLAYEPYGQEGDFHLLYTFNSMSQGLLYGSAGVVRLSQGRLSWVWPVEGDILVQGSQAQSDYYAYWAYRLALMAPGGADVFLLADDQGGGEGPQWLPDHNELFYPAGEEQLTTGIYYQFRVWLEEFTRDRYNPRGSRNTSALWQIRSLTPADGTYPDRNYQGQAAYDLLARADSGEDLYFTARVLYDHAAGRVAQVQSWAMGTREELGLADLTDQRAQTGTRDYLIRTHLATQHTSVPRWYYLEQLPDEAEEGAMSVDAVTPLASGETEGQRWSLFLLDLGLFYPDGTPPRLGWHCGINRAYIALAQSENGAYTQVLGCGDEIACRLAPQLAGILADSQVCLYRDGFSDPVGPGKPLSFSCLDTMSIEMERLEDYAPVSRPGDYWFRAGGQVGGQTFTALCCYDSASGLESIQALDTTMTDLYTPRGIQVGDSRAQVLQAYPEALTGSYQGRYPEGTDMLTFLPGSDHDPSRVTDLSQLITSRQAGSAILFFFDGDTLSQITLTNAPR